MNTFVPYNAVNAKIKTREKALLSTNGWEKLLNFNSVAEVILLLKKQYGFNEILKDIKAEEMHRDALELLLGRYVVEEIERLGKYFSGPYRQFVSTLLMEYEIYDLQLLLRKLAMGESLEHVEEHFVHSEAYTKLNYQKLLHSSTVQQFVEQLKGTPYYDALKTITQEDALKREFHMEMKLHMVFYKNLLEVAKRLSSEDCKIVQEMVGTKVDFLNVQWIYRATKYYDISPEEILIYSLSGGRNITYNRLKKLCYTKSLDDFKKLATKYLHFDIFVEEDAFVEKNIDKKMASEIKAAHLKGSSIAGTLCYIYTLNLQLKDLIAATEGIRYALPRDEIKKYLVYTI